MNLYAMVGSGIGTNEAASLSVRLSAWHDAMVAHERRLRSGNSSDSCDDECPHAEAPALWSEAVATLGPRANELVFLRSRAHDPRRGSKLSSPAQGIRTEAAHRGGDRRAIAPPERPRAARRAAEL
jgi:hypothetical protein